MITGIKRTAVTVAAITALAAVGTAASATPASATYVGPGPDCVALHEQAEIADNNWQSALAAGDQRAAKMGRVPDSGVGRGRTESPGVRIETRPCRPF
jgi:hypothetical protein